MNSWPCAVRSVKIEHGTPSSLGCGIANLGRSESPSYDSLHSRSGGAPAKRVTHHAVPAFLARHPSRRISYHDTDLASMDKVGQIEFHLISN